MRSVHRSRQIGHWVSGAAQRSHTQTCPQGTHAREVGASRQMTHCNSRGDVRDSLGECDERSNSVDGVGAPPTPPPLPPLPTPLPPSPPSPLLLAAT